MTKRLNKISKGKRLLAIICALCVGFLAVFTLGGFNSPNADIANSSNNAPLAIAPTSTSGDLVEGVDFLYMHGQRLSFDTRLRVFYINLPLLEMNSGRTHMRICMGNFVGAPVVFDRYPHLFSRETALRHYKRLDITFNNLLYQGAPFVYQVIVPIEFPQLGRIGNMPPDRTFRFLENAQIGLTQNHFTWITQRSSYDFSDVSISIFMGNGFAYPFFFHDMVWFVQARRVETTNFLGTRTGYCHIYASALHPDSDDWCLETFNSGQNTHPNSPSIPSGEPPTLWQRIVAWFNSTLGIGTTIGVVVVLALVGILLLLFIRGKEII